MESGVNFEALQIKKQTLKQGLRLEDAGVGQNWFCRSNALL
jgi:hypothetical protein